MITLNVEYQKEEEENSTELRLMNIFLDFHGNQNQISLLSKFRTVKDALHSHVNDEGCYRITIYDHRSRIYFIYNKMFGMWMRTI